MINIAFKEFLDLLYNPKILLTFAVSTVLILLGLFNGYSVYVVEKSLADQGTAIATEDAKSNENYEDLAGQGIRTSRSPSKLSIFDQGLNGIIGSKSQVRPGGRPRSWGSRYSVDPVLAVFGELDLTFTVVFILSFFAVLFSYNSVSGEREAGTLRLVMSNQVGRVDVIIGKFIGGFLPLALLLIVPFLIGIVGLLTLTDIGFSGEEWSRIGIMVGACLLYLLVFYTIGMAMSALTRSSFVSFLLCLFVWVLSVAIIPKVAVRLADFTVDTTTLDELESDLTSFRRDLSGQFGRKLKQYYDEHPTRLLELQTAMGKAINYVRKEIDKENMEFEDRKFTEFAQQRKILLQSAMLYSRASPTSCFSFAMHSLAGTGPQMAERFEENLMIFRRDFSAYLEKKEDPTGLNFQQILARIGIKSFGATPEGYVKLEILEDVPTSELDITGMPIFKNSDESLPKLVETVLPDLGILALFSIAFFALAFVSFLRYDVR
jgi:ABC-type transport system involved in multi-copper enzyme maturation permease subunit